MTKVILKGVGRKQRMTVTVDAELIDEANRAVKAGEADSVSSWVNGALAERRDRERRLRGMAAAIAAYEREHGVITQEEILAQRRADQKAAIVVRGGRRLGPGPRRGRHKAA